MLDLYAGSGALALEALSRGAASATMVEAAAAAIRVIEGNIRHLGVGARATAVRERALAYVDRSSHEWDLVFLDPPYDIAAGDLAAILASLATHVAPHAPIVLEVSSRTAAPQWPASMSVVQTKAYGETTVHFAERVR